MVKNYGTTIFICKYVNNVMAKYTTRNGYVLVNIIKSHRVADPSAVLPSNCR